MINYIDILKKLNKKCINDIPISCVIVKNDKIISKGYNTKYRKNDPLGHAEINAIRNASKKLKTSNLKDCVIYVTLKPCKMCQEIIQECRIKKVYYLCDRTNVCFKCDGYLNVEKIDNDKKRQEYMKLLHLFFENKRNKS